MVVASECSSLLFHISGDSSIYQRGSASCDWILCKQSSAALPGCVAAVLQVLPKSCVTTARCASQQLPCVTAVNSLVEGLGMKLQSHRAHSLTPRLPAQ